MIEIRPLNRIDATVRAPASKSYTHRALLVASLAEGKSTLEGPLRCEDTELTAEACRGMGASISWQAGYCVVEGVNGSISAEGKSFYLGNAGTSMRLLAGILSLGRGSYLLEGSRRMCERPIQPLLDALNRLGAKASCVHGDGCPPVLIEAGGLSGGDLTLDSSLSSQYLSAILVAAPYAAADTRIRLEGPLPSRPYVDMTMEVMRAFGATVESDQYREFRVRAGRGYQGRVFSIEGDYSLASYFFAAAAVTGGRVRVTGLKRGSAQGDSAFPEVLERMGCRVTKGDGWVEFHGPATRPVEIDMNSMPDLVQTLAVVAAFVPGRTIIRNVSNLRIKETDRLNALCRELAKMGVEVTELDDGLVILSDGNPKGACIDTYEDHRMAMSFAVAGLKAAGLRIEGEDCVGKSFPDFWERLGELC